MQMDNTQSVEQFQTFNNTLGEKQVELTTLVVDGDPWFKGTHVAAALGYSNVHQAVRIHVHDEDKEKLQNLGLLETSTPQNSNDGIQIFINESGLYTLIMTSKKPEAKAFKRWVTSVVLPSIRRSGSYSIRDEPAAPPSLEETSQRIRQLRLENDALGRQSLLATRQALLDLGQTIDATQEWNIRDRLNNLLGSTSNNSGPTTVTTHAGLFLVQEKGMSASLARKVRCQFGILAAPILRRHLGLAPNATLPEDYINVEGTRVPVKVYRVPQDLPVLEEAYAKLLQSNVYRNAVNSLSRERRRA